MYVEKQIQVDYIKEILRLSCFYNIIWIYIVGELSIKLENELR